MADVMVFIEVLDHQVVDRKGTRIGKVDSVVATIEEGRAPRVVALEIGAVPLAERLHPRFARWLRAAIRRWRLPIGRTRLPWRRVGEIGIDVHVALDAERTRAHALERWLRRHVIVRIPGTGR